MAYVWEIATFSPSRSCFSTQCGWIIRGPTAAAENTSNQLPHYPDLLLRIVDKQPCWRTNLHLEQLTHHLSKSIGAFSEFEHSGSDHIRWIPSMKPFCSSSRLLWSPSLGNAIPREVMFMCPVSKKLSFSKVWSFPRKTGVLLEALRARERELGGNLSHN